MRIIRLRPKFPFTKTDEVKRKNSVDQIQTSYLPTYDGCFVCGQAHPRGLRIRFFTGDFGQVRARFTPDPMFCGYKNIVHGGLIGALLDELLGWPIALQTGRMCVTGELSVRYLRPMPAQTVYLASADPGSNRGKYWVASGDIRDGQSVVYAKARGKYFLLSAEETAKIAYELRYQPGDPPVFRYPGQKKILDPQMIGRFESSRTPHLLKGCTP
jgi:uncharacterized protein (TIGR00369 family)